MSNKQHCRVEIMAIVLPILLFSALILLYYFTVEKRKNGTSLLNIFNGGCLGNRANFFKVRDPKPEECHFVKFNEYYRYTRIRLLLVATFGILLLIALLYLMISIYQWFADCRPCGVRKCDGDGCGSNFPTAPISINCDSLDNDTKPFEPIIGVLAAPGNVDLKHHDVSSLRQTADVGSHRTSFSLI